MRPEPNRFDREAQGKPEKGLGEPVPIDAWEDDESSEAITKLEMNSLAYIAALGAAERAVQTSLNDYLR